MKKILLILSLILSFVCMFSIVGCKPSDTPQQGDDGDNPTKPSIYISQDQVTIVKRQEVTLSVISETKLDSLSLRWTASDNAVISFEKKGTDITIKGVVPGTSDLTLTMSGKIVDTVKVTVIEPEFSVRLPEGKVVVSQGQVVTVQAITTDSQDITWTCENNKITIESQGTIARIKVSPICEEGEYTVTVKQGDKTCTFLVIVGK